MNKHPVPEWLKADLARVGEAEAEARRFLKRVEAWRKAFNTAPGTHPKESGAMKRASMDLSRSLAELRRGDQRR